MTENLLRFRWDQKYIVFDWESANLSLTSGLPWQLGAVICKGKNVIDRIERKLWWPNYEIKDEIAMLNHFNRAQYEREAISPVIVLDELESYLYNPEYLIIGQNVLGFDCYLHNTLRKTLGRKSDYSYINRVIDTKALSMAIQKGAKTAPKDDLLSWQYTWLNHRERGIKTSQGYMLKYYGIEHRAENLHNAIIDVEMTFEIFKKQIFQLEI